MACGCANGYCRCGVTATKEKDCGTTYSPGGALSECLGSFYDRKNFSWLTLRNTCASGINVVFVGNDGSGLGGATTLAPGAQDSIGRSENEVRAVKGLSYAVCPAGSNPVDANGVYWNRPGAEYRCKKEGPPCPETKADKSPSAPSPPSQSRAQSEAPALKPVAPSRASATTDDRAKSRDADEPKRREEVNAENARRAREAQDRQTRFEQAQRNARAQQADARAEQLQRDADRAIATGHGDAIASTGMAQMSRIEAIAARQGNTYAADQIRQSIEQQQTAAAVGDAVGSGVMFIFDLVQQHEREERARREREEARREAERERAENILPGWRELSTMATSVERDPDFAPFQRSAESKDCADKGNPWRSAAEVVQALEVSATEEATDRQRKSAFDTAESARASLECQGGAFKGYQERMSGLCQSLFDLEPRQLERTASEHADLPTRCVDAAREAHHQALARSLKGADAARGTSPAAGLRSVGSTSGADRMSLKPLGDAPAAANTGMTLKPVSSH